MHDLRLTQPVVLILANTLDVAVELGMRLRDAGCVAVQPRPEESAIQAIVRLRPSVVFVEAGHRELFGGTLWGVANENDVAVLMFVGRAQDVTQARERYGVHVLTCDAPARELREAMALILRDARGRLRRYERRD